MVGSIRRAGDSCSLKIAHGSESRDDQSQENPLDVFKIPHADDEMSKNEIRSMKKNILS